MRRRLLKHSLIYTSGNMLARGLNFIIQVVIWSNLFPPGAYGQIAYCYVFISFVAVILPFGFDAAFLNFYLRKRSPSVYLTNTLAFVLGAGLLFTAFAFLFRHSLDMIAIRADAPRLLSLSLLILFFDLLNNQGILYLRAGERAGLSVVLLNIEIILRLILLVLLVTAFSARIEYILWANVLSSGVLFLVLIAVMMPQIRLSGLSGRVMKEMMVFGLPFMAAGIFDRTIELADRRLLGHFMGDATVGAYVACYTVAVLLRLLVYSFNAGWQPFFLREIDKKGGMERIERIYVQTAGIFVAVWFLASLWLPDIVRIPLGGDLHILNSAYWSGIGIIPVIMGAYVMMGLYFLELPGIYYHKRTGMNAVFMGLGALVNIVLNLILIPRAGMLGAAFATASAYAAMAVAIRLWNIRRTSIPRGHLRIVALMLISAASYALLAIPETPLILRIAASLLYLVIFFTIIPLRFSVLKKNLER